MYLNTQLKCFSNDKKSNSIAIDLILKENAQEWLSDQSQYIQNFAKNNRFGENSDLLKISNISSGAIEKVVCLVTDDMYSIANLANDLVDGEYHIECS